MPITSHRSTFITNLELGSDQAYIGDAYLKLPSDGTFEADGAVDVSSGSFSITRTEGSVASRTFLAAGHLSVVSLSALTAYLVYVDSSGNTLYEWESLNGRIY